MLLLFIGERRRHLLCLQTEAETDRPFWLHRVLLLKNKFLETRNAESDEEGIFLQRCHLKMARLQQVTQRVETRDFTLRKMRIAKQSPFREIR